MSPETAANYVLAAGVVGAFMKSWLNGRSLDKIHVLVNSRLTRALEEIERLQKQVAKLTGEAVPTSVKF